MCAQKVGCCIVIGRYGYKSSFGANKKFSVIEILKYFQSSTKIGGYMEGIWRLYRDDWRLSIEDGGYSKDLEVIYGV